MQANLNPQFAAGHLLFMRGGDLGGNLFAKPFDLTRLETSGEETTVAEGVTLYGDYLGIGDYSVSSNGKLIFDAFRLQTRLVWFDRGGKETGVFGEPAPHFFFRLSPDGSRVAFSLYDTGTQTTQIWVGDVSRGVATKLTNPPSSNSGPVWSPDGSAITWQSDLKHQADIFLQQVSRPGSAEAITDSEDQSIPVDWSPDGKSILFMDREHAGGRLMQLSTLPLKPPRTKTVFLPRATNDFGDERFSPDGRWLAYDRDESGRREVYAISFPAGEHKVQISTAGGREARWTRSGREILYRDFAGRIMAVDLTGGTELKAGAPRELFPFPEGAFNWDVTADGNRFLINVPVIKSSSEPLSVVTNWASGLKKN
jgi:Tol biopolymer transport system component